MALEADPEPSVNWLEHFGHMPMADAIELIRTCLKAKMKLRKNGRFAVVHVGESIAELGGTFPEVKFEHEPEVPPSFPDPSHSVIKGIPLPQANAVAEILLEQVGDKVFPALEE